MLLRLLRCNVAILTGACLASGIAHAQDEFVLKRSPGTLSRPDEGPHSVLSPQEWQRVDAATQRALAWLASQQQPDGSFPTDPLGQPAVTSLCALAFMAHGHIPGEGEYGACLNQATDYILACQKRNGLISLMGPEGLRISRDVSFEIGVRAVYNHAISGLTLAEMYGMSRTKQSQQMERAITNALELTMEMQRWPKQRPQDRGGWRYLISYDESDSDLSVSGWQLMFLRSARNAGFNVPQRTIDDAVGYIRRTFNARLGTFQYRIQRGDDRSRGMTGAGILALAHAGFHNSVEARRAGEALLRDSFTIYNDNNPHPRRDRYHYSLLLCCQGAYQLGNPYWKQVFPPTARAVLDHQNADGSWEPESFHRDQRYGNAYTTALVVLSLGAANQFLPIFQR